VIPGLSPRSKTVISNNVPYSVGTVPVNKLKETLTISAKTRATRGEMEARDSNRRRQGDKDLPECKLSSSSGRGPTNRLFEIERDAEAKGTMYKMRSRLI
jgi:hypothetical protein